MRKVDPRALPELTGVRTLAATMVFLNHYVPPREIVGESFYYFFREMHAGVSVFFVLSGFLIYLRHSKMDLRHRASLIRYCFHRFARIYPMYFLIVVGMTAWTVSYLHGAKISSWEITKYLLLQLTFIRGFSDQYKFMGVGQGWTLTVEFTFYALFPLLLILIRRVGFIAVLVVTWFAGILLFYCGEVLHYCDYFTPFGFMLGYTFFGHAGDFFAGMMLADYVLRRSSVEERPSEAEKRKTIWRSHTFTVLGGIGIVLCLAVRARLGSADLEWGDNPLGSLISFLILPPCICSLFYGLISERTWLSYLMGSRLLVITGASSYCFYLIHVGGPGFLINAWVGMVGFIPGYLFLVACSIILWLFVEEPLRRWILSHHLFRGTSNETLSLKVDSIP